MTVEELKSALATHKNGRALRIVYQTEAPVAAAYKKLGYKVIKVTDAVTRIGVKYANMKAVKKMLAEDPSRTIQQKVGYKPVFERNGRTIISQKIDTGKCYLYTQPLEGNKNTSSIYKIYKDGVYQRTMDKLELMGTGLLISSYYNNTNFGIVRDITVDNIIEIKEVKKK